jgi:hypothetical protein
MIAVQTLANGNQWQPIEANKAKSGNRWQPLAAFQGVRWARWASLCLQGAMLAACLTQRSGAGGIGVDLIGKNGVELASVTGRGPVEAKADSPVKSKDRTVSAPGIFLSPCQDIMLLDQHFTPCPDKAVIGNARHRST